MKKRMIILSVVMSVIIISSVFFSFKVIDIVGTRGDILLKTKIFTDIIWLISDEYVDEVDSDQLFTTAIQAMLDELDPHSQYVPPRRYEDMSERFLGYQGIGVQFRMVDNKITIMRVLRDGPSERAGLKLGDRIIEIEGKNAVGMKQDDVPALLKGPQGTRVRVTVERAGVAEPFEVEITRGQAFVESIKYFYMLDEVTGYINLETFSKTSIKELDYAVRILENQGMKRLVFDLRGNGGGLLPQAKEVSDKFLDGGKVIVETKGRTRMSNQVYKSESDPGDVDFPMIVLINEESASASEIVSGALQDWDRAIVVGKTSFGKGLMQTQIEFEDHSALLLTTGRWYTPLGRLIQKPYENKSNEQYRMDAMSDSLNKEREQEIDRPEFTTPLGRIVYGGGGITPDYEITSTNLVSRYAIEMNAFSAEQPIFRYAQEITVKNPDKWNDVYELIENYSLDGAELEKYKTFMDKINYKYDNENLEKYKGDIEKYIEANMAQFLWGDEAYWRVFQVGDNVLADSQKYFSDAVKLQRGNN